MRHDLNGAAITVMGLGRFGGGAGAVRYCAEQGARVLLTDLLAAEELAEPLVEIEDLVGVGGVRLRLGAHVERDFTEADLIVASPAVPQPWTNRYLAAATRAGVPVTTEIGLACERLPDHTRVVAVTGTAGKSTTTAMIGHGLRQVVSASPVHVGGNLGGSLLGERIEPDDYVILELSSAQMHWLREAAARGVHRPLSPRVAVVTSFAANHLDWHGKVEHYRDSKAAIHAQQTASDFAVLAEVGVEWEMLTGAAQVVRPEYDALLPGVAGVMRLPGRHNAVNAVTAAQAVSCLLGPSKAASIEELARMAATFPGLPHRLRLVHEAAGKRAYDDSKSTTPASSRLAVEAFDDPARVHLILGGYDKKIDLSGLVETAGRCGGAYPIGAVGSGLARELGVEDCGTLEVAVARAAAVMRPGDVLLLSPGCASWDQFRHFEERGERFATLARACL
jgi:UDP-N-acetylmuramoylalanine--D-glutamate ligase